MAQQIVSTMEVSTIAPAIQPLDQLYIFRKPMISPRITGLIIHSLLYNCPFFVLRKDKRMVVQRMAILNRGIIYFCCHPTAVLQAFNQ